ncbi:hypothetical protein A2U01_0049797, partial [Trifolium medium]|nr:hypothetical protein [Trifolium medium]
MAAKEVVASETFEIDIDFSDWDYLVEHEDVNEDEQLCSEWERPIVVADTNLDPPSLTPPPPPKKSSNMSLADR